VAVDQAVLDADVRKAREFEALLARAESGDDDAAFELAERYRQGRDVAANPAEAKRWYLRAADAGHDRARELLVSSYIRDTLYGYEPKPDFTHLLPWIKDAARGGNVIALQLLARKYAQGEDVPQDLYEARRWLQALADQGDSGAQFSLGVMFHQGVGVLPDPKAAHRWFEAAGKQGEPRAQYMLALMRYYGRGIERDLGEARRWAALAFQQGDSEVRGQALTLLGTLDALLAGTANPPPPPPERPPVPASGAKPSAPGGPKPAAASKSAPAAGKAPSGPPSGPGAR
jgi:hypothetical protein